MTLTFTCFGKAEPQGSARAFIIGGKARITSANPKMKSFRQEITGAAINATNGELFAEKHVPVSLGIDFYFAKPASVSRKRTRHVVKPDIDKICRSVCDSLTGVIYHDDAQVVEVSMRKHYGVPERVEITVTKE